MGKQGIREIAACFLKCLPESGYRQVFGNTIPHSILTPESAQNADRRGCFHSRLSCQDLASRSIPYKWLQKSTGRSSGIATSYKLLRAKQRIPHKRQ
jgi:hypothetical protein